MSEERINKTQGTRSSNSSSLSEFFDMFPKEDAGTQWSNRRVAKIVDRMFSDFPEQPKACSKAKK